MTTTAPPQNCIVLCRASFDSSTSALKFCEDALLIPRESIATLKVSPLHRCYNVTDNDRG
ncbi:hypothetical protein K440DRAFT_632408 [Wilcoxina mikolae CBS 423.85]|nr:hypothetical protein K440DRAFT_632408 [Wilcoxina mikolae CBS 423.85]